MDQPRIHRRTGRALTRLPAVAGVMTVAAALAAGAALAAPTMTVAPGDQTLYPPASMSIMPDEHTTIVPVWGPRHGSGPGPGYLAFVAGNNFGQSGTYALETSDLIHFSLAAGYGNPAVHAGSVMWPPNDFTNCQYTGPTVFDQNYSAPGGVLQDPTRPPGNFIMVYEAERHCPAGGGGAFEFNYWASVGVAQSHDFGRTWQQPGHYGNSRYAAITIPGTEPPVDHPAYGDALPSAFVDDVKRDCGDDKRACPPRDYYLYAIYYFNGSPAQAPDGRMRIARARLGGEGPLQFRKWYVDPVTQTGGWSQDGLGGLDSGVTPGTGCAGASYQVEGQISYVDALRVYLLTFVCVNLQKQPDGSYAQVQAGWYYSTAQSLETQNWSQPQLMLNSLKPVTTDSSGGGRYFDGWYPSFMSPGCKPGHLSLAGQAFFLDGNSIGVAHQFAARSFRIDPGPGDRRFEGCEDAHDTDGPPLGMSDIKQILH